ncbi:MAG: patatin-like phospholipase family protein [Alphaproteobacteria bacterium]|nr:patatin-like phospholipase family protein [Alphaproteobacteria bacterium]MBV8407235.1 patatin-like phospholipase family protein [Alphaproteobacteria bacterium]
MSSPAATGRTPAGAKARPDFERIALLLQGGGALGAYQAGVYQALAEAGLQPDWVAGISIGAINSALIAGNAPEQRVERLRTFWETVSAPPLGIPSIASLEAQNDTHRLVLNQMRATAALLYGAPSFFHPRLPPPFLPADGPTTLSYYDTGPLKSLLGRLVDFDRINRRETRFSVGAVNIRTGNFTYFDNTTHTIGPQHVMASGSLPPGFPATEVDGEHYWDGGLVSNTPLQWVLDAKPRLDTLAFQVDLWSARGELPRDMVEVDSRQKDIRYSSRTRAGTDSFRNAQALRRAAAKLLEQMPEALRQTPEAALLAQNADHKVYNIIHTIYRAQRYESTCKDYEFSRRTMEEHWKAGYADMTRTLGHPEVLERPTTVDGVFTFDLAVQGRD